MTLGLKSIFRQSLGLGINLILSILYDKFLIERRPPGPFLQRGRFPVPSFIFAGLVELLFPL